VWTGVARAYLVDRCRSERKGVVGESRLPQPGSELGDPRGGMLAHALQDIDEIDVRVDALEPASRDQALHDASVLGADLGPAKEPVLRLMRLCS